MSQLYGITVRDYLLTALLSQYPILLTCTVILKVLQLAPSIENFKKYGDNHKNICKYIMVGPTY